MRNKKVSFVPTLAGVILLLKEAMSLELAMYLLPILKEVLECSHLSLVCH